MMPQENDRAYAALELREIADSLKTRLKLLAEAGLTVVPSSGATVTCPEGVAVLGCGPGEFYLSSPCTLHALWEGVLFGCWVIQGAGGKDGSAAIIWGTRVSARSRTAERPSEPFHPESMEQFLRMVEWLSGELNTVPPSPDSFRLFLSGRCLDSGGSGLDEAIPATAPALEHWISEVKPMAVLLMGDHAVRALSGGEKAKGEPFDKKGLMLMPTWSPDDMLSSRARKKEAHGHLKGFIKVVRPEA